MWDTWKSRQQSAIQEIISVSTCRLSHGAEHQLSLCWYLHQLSHLFKPVALHPDLPRSLSPPACMCRYQEAVILTGTRHHWDRWAFGFLRRLPLSCQAYLYCHFQYEQNYAGTNPDGVRNMKCSAVAGILEILRVQLHSPQLSPHEKRSKFPGSQNRCLTVLITSCESRSRSQLRSSIRPDKVSVLQETRINAVTKLLQQNYSRQTLLY